MNLLNLEDEKFKVITIKGYKFKIRYMSPIDMVQIAQKRMQLQSGQPVDAMTQNDFTFFENIAIVDICVEEFPEEFNENESCLNWPLPDLINDVANEIKNHTKSLETKLKKNRPIAGSTK